MLVDDQALNDSDKTFTVPATEDWEIEAIYAQLITDATVGNRIMQLLIDDGADTYLLLRTAVTQAASLTRRYHYWPGGPARETAFVNDSLILPLPGPLVLPAGHRIRIFDEAAIAAAADDLTVRVLGVQRTR